MDKDFYRRFKNLFFKPVALIVIGGNIFSPNTHAQTFFRDEGFMTHLAWELNDTYDSISRIAQISFPWGNQMMLVGGIGQQYVTFGSGSAYMGSTSWMLFDLEGNWNPDFTLNSGGGGGVNRRIYGSSGGFIFSSGFGFSRLDSRGQLDTAWRSHLQSQFVCGMPRAFVDPADSMIYIGTFNCNAAGSVVLPNQHYTRLYPDATWDSSFVVPIGGIEPLSHLSADSMIYIGGKFYSVHGRSQPGIARLRRSDGSLDTSFRSIFSNSNIEVHPEYLDERGRLWVSGFLQLMGDSIVYGMFRLLPDGRLDSSFNNFNNVRVKTPGILGLNSVSLIERIQPNLFLVGGAIDSFQNSLRGDLVAVDSNGFLLPEYFPEPGIDSSRKWHNGVWESSLSAVNSIVKGPDGMVYVGGTFLQYMGEDVPPVLRFKWSPAGLEEEELPSDPLYPNPVSRGGVLYHRSIESPLKIYSLDGRLLLGIAPEALKSGFEVPMDWSPGLYFWQSGKESGKLMVRDE